MPGMGSYGTETIGGFYPYLFIDLLIILGLVWVCWGVRVAFRYLDDREGAVVPWASDWLAKADHSLPARVFLRRAIGLLWIGAGLLQAQPAMPGGFAKNVLEPLASRQPHVLSNLLNWEAYFWSAHPLDLAVAAVLIQIGLGVAILTGGDSRLGRTALWASIAWGLFIWVGGEALGGLLAPGASLLTGTPGAVLVYVAAAGLLLLPVTAWESGRIYRAVRIGAGVVFVFGALLQALPWDRFWTARGLSALFLSMSKVSQLAFLSAPGHAVGHLARSYPLALNSALVAVLAILGAGLIWGRAPKRWTVAALVGLALIWWIGQDFGVLGGKTATNLGLAPVLGVMLVSAWIGASSDPAVGRAGQVRLRSVGFRKAAALGGLLALGVALVPVLLGLPVAAAQSATIEALNTGGGLNPMNDQSLPDLTLVNQAGRPVDLRQWSDKAVVLTFLDPVCFYQCPVIAEQIAYADRQLGPLAKDVEFVAVVANPIYRSLSTVRAFDSTLDMNQLPNWQYLTGSLPQLERVWAAFSLPIEVPRLQMVDHPTLLYFVKPGGQEVSLTQDTALGEASVITSYSSLIDEQLRSIIDQ